MPGVFTYKADSPYDDVPGERYHFPKTYLSRVQQLKGDFVLFHELADRGRGRGAYVSFARVRSVDRDELRQDHFYARLSDAGELGIPVPVTLGSAAVEPSFNAQNAVRIISHDAFRRALDLAEAAPPQRPEDAYAFAEDEIVFERPLDEVVRARRVEWFRERVLAAYESRCALTGMRLVNGGGAREVEAAHIRSVEDGGPDLVSNGMALTRTVHWMFDRHLITFGDDRQLIRTPMLSAEASRFLGNISELSVPSRALDRPAPTFLRWHREKTMRKTEAYLREH